MGSTAVPQLRVPTSHSETPIRPYSHTRFPGYDSPMHKITDGVWRFRFLAANMFNAYYVTDGREAIVIDASTRWDFGPMRRQLAGKIVHHIALTHAHPDHQGCAARLARMFNCGLAVHEQEVASAEGHAPLVRQNFLFEIAGKIIWAGRCSKVTRPLREGDTIAGFTVYHMPGHTQGHIVFFRESDRVAIVGDVVNTNHPIFPFLTSVREPPTFFSANPAQNRASIKRLASLRPAIICAGHGPIVYGDTKLQQLAARL